MDLFDLLEKVFRGIVYFIYNVVETTWTTVRHPIKGPLRLSLRHEDADARQIGGLTYLFLILVLLQAYSLSGDLSHKALADVVPSAPKLDTDAMWPEIVAALVATVTIDAILRLLLRWRLPDRPRLRHTLLSMSEFAMLWMVVAFAFLAAAVPNSSADEVWLPFLGGFGVIASSYVPATILLGAGTPLRRRIRQRRAKLPSAMVGVLFLFLVAVFGGASFGETIQSKRTEQKKSSELALETLRCQVLADGRIAADGLAHFENGAAMAIEPKDLRLDAFLGDSTAAVSERRPVEGAPLDGWPVEWRQPDAQRVIVIEPGHAQVLEVVTRSSIGVSGEGVCMLSWQWGSGEHDLLLGKAARPAQLDEAPLRPPPKEPAAK